MAEEGFRTAFRHYRIVRQLGEGGAGRVFEVAADDGSRFALKLLNAAGITSERIKRFQNEIAFCQRRVHPAIVRVLDVGFSEEGGQRLPFYVMPLYEKTLRQLIEEGLDSSRAFNIFTQIVEAVAAAHSNGVSHRDLKPENILADSEGSIAVADFGIARFENFDAAALVVTRKGSRLANFQYAAPEQRAKGQKVTGQSDVYALGLIGHEMLTGEVPLGAGAKSVLDVHPNLAFMDAILQEMRQQSPENRPALSTVIEKIRSQGPIDPSPDSHLEGTGNPNPLGDLGDLAARVGARHRHEQERRTFFRSSDGVDRTRASFEAIRSNLAHAVKELGQILPFSIRAEPNAEYLEIISDGIAAVPQLRITYANSLDGVRIRFTIWRGAARLPGRMFYEDPEELETRDFYPDLDSGGVVVWRRDDTALLWSDEGVLSESDVVHELLALYLKTIERNLGIGH